MSIHRIWWSVSSLASGFVLGVVTWGEGRAPSLAVLLPLLVAILPARVHSALLVFGYELALLRTHPAFLAGWFGDNVAVGWVMASGFAGISALVWSTGWSRERSAATTFLGQQGTRVIAMAFAWLLALLPPSSIFMPAHPVVGWGYIAPGMGWAGVIASLVIPVAMALAWFKYESFQRTRVATLLAIVVTLGLHGQWAGEGPESVSGEVAAVSTSWGRISTIEAGLDSIGGIGSFIRSKSLAGVNTYFWPESIVGVYDPSLAPVMTLEVLRPAIGRSQVHVIGMDLKSNDGGLKSIAVAYYPDGRTSVAQARQPAVVSLWRPWSKNSYEADWQASHVLSLPDGRRAAVLFCYEEFIPALFLLTQATVRPDLYVAMSNTWASPDTIATTIQSSHSLGMAKLFGMPFIKAENRPLKAIKTQGRQFSQP